MDYTQWTEWLAVAFNIGYVILAARKDRRCWLLGIAGVVLSFLVYVWSQLYSDATLQVFYFVMAIYGWVTWGRYPVHPFKSQFMTFGDHRFTLVTGIVGGLALGLFWSGFGASFPYLDGLTTSFSILATWLTARRFIESWLYWIAINLVCIGIYTAKGIYAFVFLFIVYTLLAAYGYRAWRTLPDELNAKG